MDNTPRESFYQIVTHIQNVVDKMETDKSLFYKMLPKIMNHYVDVCKSLSNRDKIQTCIDQMDIDTTGYENWMEYDGLDKLDAEEQVTGQKDLKESKNTSFDTYMNRLHLTWLKKIKERS